MSTFHRDIKRIGIIIISQLISINLGNQCFGPPLNHIFSNSQEDFYCPWYRNLIRHTPLEEGLCHTYSLYRNYKNCLSDKECPKDSYCCFSICHGITRCYNPFINEWAEKLPGNNQKSPCPLIQLSCIQTPPVNNTSTNNKTMEVEPPDTSGEKIINLPSTTIPTVSTTLNDDSVTTPDSSSDDAYDQLSKTPTLDDDAKRNSSKKFGSGDNSTKNDDNSTKNTSIENSTASDQTKDKTLQANTTAFMLRRAVSFVVSGNISEEKPSSSSKIFETNTLNISQRSDGTPLETNSTNNQNQTNQTESTKAAKNFDIRNLSENMYSNFGNGSHETTTPTKFIKAEAINSSQSSTSSLLQSASSSNLSNVIEHQPIKNLNSKQETNNKSSNDESETTSNKVQENKSSSNMLTSTPMSNTTKSLKNETMSNFSKNSSSDVTSESESESESKSKSKTTNTSSNDVSTKENQLGIKNIEYGGTMGQNYKFPKTKIEKNSETNRKNMAFAYSSPNQVFSYANSTNQVPSSNPSSNNNNLENSKINPNQVNNGSSGIETINNEAWSAASSDSALAFASKLMSINGSPISGSSILVSNTSPMKNESDVDTRQPKPIRSEVSKKNLENDNKVNLESHNNTNRPESNNSNNSSVTTSKSAGSYTDVNNNETKNNLNSGYKTEAKVLKGSNNTSTPSNSKTEKSQQSSTQIQNQDRSLSPLATNDTGSNLDIWSRKAQSFIDNYESVKKKFSFIQSTRDKNENLELSSQQSKSSNSNNSVSGQQYGTSSNTASIENNVSKRQDDETSLNETKLSSLTKNQSELSKTESGTEKTNNPSDLRNISSSSINKSEENKTKNIGNEQSVLEEGSLDEKSARSYENSSRSLQASQSGSSSSSSSASNNLAQSSTDSEPKFPFNRDFFSNRVSNNWNLMKFPTLQIPALPMTPAFPSFEIPNLAPIRPMPIPPLLPDLPNIQPLQQIPGMSTMTQRIPLIPFSPMPLFNNWSFNYTNPVPS